MLLKKSTAYFQKKIKHQRTGADDHDDKTNEHFKPLKTILKNQRHSFDKSSAEITSRKFNLNYSNG
jgi:hypothetical protein